LGNPAEETFCCPDDAMMAGPQDSRKKKSAEKNSAKESPKL